jgi:hypothetical protein
MPPHRWGQFAAPTLLGFVQPQRSTGKANGSRQNNNARALPNSRLSPRHSPVLAQGRDAEISTSAIVSATVMA